MVEVARELAPDLEWHVGVAESLPFEDRSFDAVVSQFALMFLDDRSRALREMLRVLVPGGRLSVLVWNAIETMPAYASEAALFERMAGQAAADAVRPHGSAWFLAQVRTEPFLAAQARALGGTLDRVTRWDYPLEATMAHHRESARTIDVGAYRLAWP